MTTMSKEDRKLKRTILSRINEVSPDGFDHLNHVLMVGNPEAKERVRQEFLGQYKMFFHDGAVSEEEYRDFIGSYRGPKRAFGPRTGKERDKEKDEWAGENEVMRYFCDKYC